MEKGDSSSRKRQRDEEDNNPQTDTANQFSSLEYHLNFSDTMVALQMMRAQFPHHEKISTLPFILRSQLYSSVMDRTQVDRELESLRREKVLRIFKLNTGQDDHAIMFVDDYLSQVERVVKRLESKKQPNLSVIEWFKNHVIQSKLDPSIGHEELVSNSL
ncbi:hypothetical protein Leryth_015979 [Lithospermum erythrorhizon]|nr:hypothetical protein Leryth_015979 [Lithospermum erythrorhizon]